MREKIAVDDKLGYVKEALQEEGYEVMGLTDDLASAQAVIVSGMDDNFLGHQETSTKATVIDASGRDLTSIIAEVKRATKITR